MVLNKMSEILTLKENKHLLKSKLFSHLIWFKQAANYPVFTLYSIFYTILIKLQIDTQSEESDLTTRRLPFHHKIFKK